MNTIQISDVVIRQNESQLFNLNDLHQAAGSNENHKPANWLRNQQTKELIAEIEAQGGTATQVIHGGKNRGTFVCKELVYAYATWISAKFFLLVIRTFDEVVSGSLKAKTTVSDRTGLRQAISALVSKKGLSYSDAYNLVHQRFGVGSIDELSYEQLVAAIEYVHALMVANEMQAGLSQEYFTLLAKMANYAQCFKNIQKMMCENPNSPQANQFLNSLQFPRCTNTNQTGFLFVFKPDIERDIQQTYDFLHAQSQVLQVVNA